MCKASSEPGGPHRCSGDARTNLERSEAAVRRQEEWHRNLEEYMNGVPKQWGPNIGPPPFAPPFGEDFDTWFARENTARGGTYSREDAYAEFYNLAGDPEDWARMGYSTGQATPPANPAPAAGGANSALHAALRRAVAERTDADLDELDAEVAAATQQRG